MDPVAPDPAPTEQSSSRVSVRPKRWQRFWEMLGGPAGWVLAFLNAILVGCALAYWQLLDEYTTVDDAIRTGVVGSSLLLLPVLASWPIPALRPSIRWLGLCGYILLIAALIALLTASGMLLQLLVQVLHVY